MNIAFASDEFYLNAQIDILKESLELFIMKYNPKYKQNFIS